MTAGEAEVLPAPNEVVKFIVGLMEAVADMSEKLGALEESSGLQMAQLESLGQPTVLFGLLSSMTDEQAGSFIKLIGDLMPLATQMQSIANLSPQEKQDLARELRERLRTKRPALKDLLR